MNEVTLALILTHPTTTAALRSARPAAPVVPHTVRAHRIVTRRVGVARALHRLADRIEPATATS